MDGSDVRNRQWSFGDKDNRCGAGIVDDTADHNNNLEFALAEDNSCVNNPVPHHEAPGSVHRPNAGLGFRWRFGDYQNTPVAPPQKRWNTDIAHLDTDIAHLNADIARLSADIALKL